MATKRHKKHKEDAGKGLARLVVSGVMVNVFFITGLLSRVPFVLFCG